MKKTIWATPNKQLISTGHKEFDRQTNIISTGNIYANTQTGGFVRHWEDKGRDLVDNCGEFEGQNDRVPGYLFKWDMKNFPDIQSTVYGCIETIARASTKAVIVYEFFHYNEHKKIIHGYIVTTGDNHLIWKYAIAHTYKSHLVLDECQRYICNEPESDLVGNEQHNQAKYDHACGYVD